MTNININWLDTGKKCQLEEITKIYKELTEENRRTLTMFSQCMILAQNSVKGA